MEYSIDDQKSIKIVKEQLKPNEENQMIEGLSQEKL